MPEKTKEIPVSNSKRALSLGEIQQKLRVPKSQFNKFGNFYYRNCEDILEAVKPLLEGLQLLLIDEVVLVGDRHYVKATASLEDDSGMLVAEVTAYARESETEAGMKSAQVTGSTSSYARKYALNGLFLIDDGDDPDNKDDTAKPVESAKAYENESGEIARDAKGHTACVACGRAVSEKVEKYSLSKYNKVLCMPCQSKDLEQVLQK